jgi:hypothetical protein
METTSFIAPTIHPKLSEKFLHHVWKFGWFNSKNLTTVTGQEIEILHAGLHNHNAGPDFMNARIRMDDTIWWGNVEIHIRASDWHRHNHQSDDNYKNVILHVVLFNDTSIYLHNPGDLQVLDLSQCLDWNIWEAHQQWLNNYRWIPCESVIHKAEHAYWCMAIDRLLIERLQDRVEYLFKTLERTGGNWSQVAFVELCKAFGFKSNSLPMEMLANSIPYSVMLRHSSDPLQLEAILFGQAGMLQGEMLDEYGARLRDEYAILKLKHDLTPLSKSIWNFGKVRPSNSPMLRIAQLASVLSRTKHLASSLLNLEGPELATLLAAQTHPYWETHKQFGIRRKKPLQTSMGKMSTEQLIINVAARLRFAHGKHHNNVTVMTDALDLLHSIPSEQNKVIHNWNKLGIKSDDAGDSQALIQLYSVYCSQERCIECPIGISLLNTPTHETHS